MHLTLKGANKLAESLGLSAIDKQSGVCSFKPKHGLCYDHKDDIGVDLDHAFWIKVNNKTRNNHHQCQSNSPRGASKQPRTQPQSRPQFIPQGRDRQLNPPPWVTRPGNQAAAMQPARGHHHQPQGEAARWHLARGTGSVKGIAYFYVGNGKGVAYFLKTHQANSNSL